ncbi:MAG: phosphopentomutase [Myxococcales bacterium]|nr:phosphopentomutase [Myxococcales bacterium]
MAAPAIERALVIVMDSVGCGAAPDAADYGDVGSNTLGNVARAVGGMTLPNLERLGLGNLTDIAGVAPRAAAGAYGRMQEASAGKDTTTGHWEMAGLRVTEPFKVFPRGFPKALLDELHRRTGRGHVGNKPSSGTEILDELGAHHVETGELIVYTSADSVFQVAAHEQVVPLDELYRYCEIARSLLDEHNVGRVIARPFIGDGPGAWKRTYNRRDFSMVPPEPTVLDAICERGLPVVGVGKIPDIYAHRGVTEEVHTEGNADGMRHTVAALGRIERGLVFVNLVDFDMLYGHRNDVPGYYRCLQEFDALLPEVEACLRPGDAVFLTADHGNDPTTPGTDHTRELVPILAFGPRIRAGTDLGTRRTFADLGATLAEAFGARAPRYGQSFLGELS